MQHDCRSSNLPSEPAISRTRSPCAQHSVHHQPSSPPAQMHTWLEMAAAVSGELTSPFSHASYASATASAGTPMSAQVRVDKR